MMNISKKLTDLIGETPLLELGRYMRKHALKGRLIAKLEYFNPAGSAKDRVAYAMIADAERRGVLKDGGTIIEPTSGNTGIGLALVAAVKGYRLILTMPETMSVERRNLLAAYGCELVLTPGYQGMQGAIDRAEELRESIPGAVILGQFDNPANPDVHKRLTGYEIWRDTNGYVDVFVATVGTGGTVSGCGAALKERNPNVCVVAVEPSESPTLSCGVAGPHRIQGIGAGFVPKNYDATVVDKVVTVSAEEAFTTCRELARIEGLFVGISSGAAVAAATKLASKPEYEDKMMVVLLPDSGERYLSVL